LLATTLKEKKGGIAPKKEKKRGPGKVIGTGEATQGWCADSQRGIKTDRGRLEGGSTRKGGMTGGKSPTVKKYNNQGWTKQNSPRRDAEGPGGVPMGGGLGTRWTSRGDKGSKKKKKVTGGTL